jgi:hypothetical protein
VSKPRVCCKTYTKGTRFFDLPREIRDVIYGYSVISTMDHKIRVHPDGGGPALCRCDQSRLFVTLHRPPYIAYELARVANCLVPDRRLYSVSLVPKQFAAEIRSTFFKRVPFSLQYRTYAPLPAFTSFGRPSTFHYEEFIHGLGPETKELRRLEISILVDASDEDRIY